MQRRGNAPDAGPSHPLQTTTIGLHAADQGRRSPRSVQTQFRRRCTRSRNTGRTSVRTQRRVGAECATDAPVSSIAGKRDAWLSCSRAQATRGRQRSSAHTTSRENPRQKIAGSCRCCVLGHDLWFRKKIVACRKGTRCCGCRQRVAEHRRGSWKARSFWETNSASREKKLS